MLNYRFSQNVIKRQLRYLKSALLASCLAASSGCGLLDTDEAPLGASEEALLVSEQASLDPVLDASEQAVVVAVDAPRAVEVSNILAGTTADPANVSAVSPNEPAAPIKKSTFLSGQAHHKKPMSVATVTVYDVDGKSASTVSGTDGHYQLDIEGLTPPLMVVGEDASRQLVSLVPTVPVGGVVVNLNPLADRITSLVATDPKLNSGVRGPSGFASNGKAPVLATQTVLDSKVVVIRNQFKAALLESGVIDVDSFNPMTVSTSSEASNKFNQFLNTINYNRSVFGPSGERAYTQIFDPLWHEITTGYAGGTFSFSAWKEKKDLIDNPSTVRVHVVGDSTVSNYTSAVAPKKGWGQQLQAGLVTGGNTQVINYAQAGRSSRSFIEEGWFANLAENLKSGDYLLIQFGHNDQKCGNSEPAQVRDPIDLARLCTYPNDANGAIQGSDMNMSFQRNLEKYVALAKSKGATPILISPVARRPKGSDLNKQFRRGHSSTRGLYKGDYTATVQKTAVDNNVTFIDLEGLSINYVNSFNGNIGQNYLATKDYYMSVSELEFPYYTPTTSGNYRMPDNTHFSSLGAQALANLVVQAIKAQPALTDLARRFQ